MSEYITIFKYVNISTFFIHSEQLW